MAPSPTTPSFQAVDVHKAQMKLESGRSEIDFNDSYRFNMRPTNSPNLSA